MAFRVNHKRIRQAVELLASLRGSPPEEIEAATTFPMQLADLVLYWHVGGVEVDLLRLMAGIQELTKQDGRVLAPEHVWRVLVESQELSDLLLSVLLQTGVARVIYESEDEWFERLESTIKAHCVEVIN